MRLLVIADTHVPDFARELPAPLMREAAASDLVVHAGDVTRAEVLQQLVGLAPTVAALGNGDGDDVAAWGAEAVVRRLDEGVPYVVVHETGPTRGRPARLRRRFPDARLVIYGHSHIPMDLEVDGQRLFNPGSPTWKRRQPSPTYGVVTLGAGRIRTRLVSLPVA